MPIVEECSDEQDLVVKAAAGSRESFDRLAGAVQPGLRAAARKLTGHDADADELVQETLTAAFHGFKSLRHPGAWRGWIYQILVRRNYDRLLKRRRPERKKDAPVVADPLSNLLQDEAKQIALQTLETMNPPLKEVLSLRFLQDLRLKDIAVKLGRPLGTIKSLLHEGLRSFEETFRRRLP
jgi:RNA polymerase sigma-70 factor (ECF subfamily)